MNTGPLMGKEEALLSREPGQKNTLRLHL